MNRPILKTQEQVFTHSYRFERFKPPVTVVATVTSRWGSEGRFQYENKKVMSLNLVTSGTGEYQQEGASGAVQPGEVFIAHQGKSQLFKTGPDGFLHKRSLLIAGDGLEGVMRSTGLINLNCVALVSPAQTIALFRQAHELMHSKPQGFITELSAIAYRVLVSLASSISPEYPAEIRTAIQFMRQNLNRQVTLEEIAVAGQMSVRHCTRMFSRYLNRSPMNFLVEQKMAAAQDILAHSELPIKLIADALGYEDPFHFSYQFKRHAGVSPKFYRMRRSSGEAP